MRLPDNSDAACLIKADWLEDHGQAAEARWLREEVSEGPRVGGIGVGNRGIFGGVGGVGGSVGGIGGIGGFGGGDVGYGFDYVGDIDGCIGNGFGVGGNGGCRVGSGVGGGVGIYIVGDHMS